MFIKSLLIFKLYKMLCQLSINMKNLQNSLKGFKNNFLGFKILQKSFDW